MLTDGFAKMALPLSDKAIADFRAYYELLEERNRVMNLTAISGQEDVARLHFLDCCAVLCAGELGGRSVIDIGAGAGFPGVPLKIACPDIRLTMLDSQRKRVGFLKDVCDLLGWDDVACLHDRAETAAVGALRESFDFAVSRAVARLNVLCELCLPFVKVGGSFLAMKGPDCLEELTEAQTAAEKLGGSMADTFCYTIPGTDITHSVVRVRKISETPVEYPRSFARIQKQPL